MQEPPSPLLPPRYFPMNVTVTRDAICKEKEKEKKKESKQCQIQLPQIWGPMLSGTWDGLEILIRHYMNSQRQESIRPI